jgi:hypothetical protein
VANILHLTYETGAFAGYLGTLLGLLNVLAKGCLGVIIMMWVRWTLPRMRIDQVMATCLKYCTPIAAVMFLGAILWQVNFFAPVQLPSPNHWFPAGTYREFSEDLPKAAESDEAPGSENGDGTSEAVARQSQMLDSNISGDVSESASTNSSLSLALRAGNEQGAQTP